MWAGLSVNVAKVSKERELLIFHKIRVLMWFLPFENVVQSLFIFITVLFHLS